jgi:hypothetical protein
MAAAFVPAAAEQAARRRRLCVYCAHPTGPTTPSCSRAVTAGRRTSGACADALLGAGAERAGLTGVGFHTLRTRARRC